jgi:glycosyltransferase involved in cell wall biosynthesis
MLRFIDLQERWIPKHVDAVTVASKALETKLLKEGTDKNKLFYVPNGKPERCFEVNEQSTSSLRRSLGLQEKQVILLYTRFFEYKLDLIVDIISHVQQSIPEAKLLVVGKGEFGEELRLQELLGSRGLIHAVVFAGWIFPEDIPKYLAIGDVAIYPLDDTILNRAKCPGKLIELMAAGRAIVASNVGQIKEYIEDGVSGFLVDTNDGASFGSLVTKVLTDSGLKSKLQDNSKDRITACFNWRKLANNVEAAIEVSKRQGLDSV